MPSLPDHCRPRLRAHSRISIDSPGSRSDLRLWNLEDGPELVSMPLDDLVVCADYFRGVDLAFSPDSMNLAVGGKQLRIYRLRYLGAGPQ